MAEKIRILIVDDDPDHREMVHEFLHLAGFDQVELAGDIAGLWSCLAQGEYDIVLLDYRLPDGNGLDAIAGLAQRGLPVPVIMITGQGDERVAVQAIQRGASDYLIKSGDYLVTLPSLIQKTIDAQHIKRSMERSIEQVRYQAMLLNNVRDAVVVWDLEGKITYWNPAASTLFGWTAEDRLGKLVGEVYLHSFQPAIKLPISGETTGQAVLRKYVTPEKKTIWVSSRVTALQDASAQDRLIGYMDVAHDMTRRKEAEEALRAERNFVSTVLDTVGALVFVYDRNGRILRINRAAEETLGYPVNEVRGKHAWDFLFSKEEREAVQALFAEIQAGRFPLDSESAIQTRGGQKRLISWANTAIPNTKGQADYIIAAGIDITERRQAEAALAQAARLATIGELASGVAHQINNPLTTIIADAQILLRSLPAGLEGRDSAEAIEQAGWRLQEVVKRLLEFSRPGPGTLENLDVNETIRQAVLLVGAYIESAGVYLDVKLQPDLPTLRGNGRQLEDLWVNLLLLARDGCTGQGDHTIQVISRVEDSGELVVEVTDDGQPIPAEQLAMVFEPYFLGPTAGRGTGMEYSICQEIVRQHGGQISVESEPSRVTIFKVGFPSDILSGTKSAALPVK